jgi:uncharacterized phage-associated protein
MDCYRDRVDSYLFFAVVDHIGMARRGTEVRRTRLLQEHMAMRFEFDPEKAVEAIIYVARKTSGDMYLTLKLLYLADKIHLEKYGSLIYGEKYAALPFGPVPSSAYDVVKYVKGVNTSPDGAEHAVQAFTMAGNAIQVLREADMNVFSRSDIQALNESIDRYGKLSFGQLQKLTHDDAFHATNENGTMSLNAIAATLPNAADLIQHLSDPHPGYAEKDG